MTSPAPRVVLGIDPGAWLGWCALRVEAAAHLPHRDAGLVASYLAGGVLSVAELGEVSAVRAMSFGLSAVLPARLPEKVAIERVERVLPTLAFQRGAAQQAGRLVDAAWIGGLVAGAYREKSVCVTEISADAVRRHFVAPTGPVKRGEKKPDMDGVLLAVAQQRIAGWPEHLPGTGAAYQKSGKDLLSNRRSHVVDAALCALWAAEH